MLDPLAHASRLITEAARSLESEKLPDVVFELDRLARVIERAHQAREEAAEALIAQRNAEFAEYERRFTPQRDFIAAATASAWRA